MNTHTSLGRRIVAALGTLALGLAGVVGVSTAAMASQPDDGTAPGNAPSDSSGTLSIHKHAGTSSGDVNNGTVQDIERPALAGVTFEICRVEGIDLTTSAGWEKAKTADATEAKCAADTSRDQTTGSDGLAEFPGLPIGLYLVRETNTPTDVTAARPFLVSIPYPSTSGTGDAQTTNWLWTVHVYPKNTITGNGGKTVGDPSALGLGSTVPWTITTRPIGSFNEGAPLTKYVLKDVLPEGLTYVENSTTLKFTTPDGTSTSVPASNYTIATPDDTETGGKTVTVTFSEDGLTWLNTLQAGTYLTWDLKTTVTKVGTLKNQAFENTGGADVETGTATTVWGYLRVEKIDADKSTGLKDATFSVYDTDKEGKCAAQASSLGEPIAVNGAKTFTSDASGVVAIKGLYISKGETDRRGYCIVEIEAPAGYILNATPRLVTAFSDEGVTLTEPPKIPNTKQSVPALPLTGANGQLLALIGGGALVLLAGGTALVARKRSHQKQD